MAVNLVSSFGRARARELLASSFAQFQADRSVVGLARAAAKHEQEAERVPPRRCTPTAGTSAQYAELRRQIGDREKELSRDSQAKRRIEAAEALAALRPGDVIRVPSGRRQGLAVVLDAGITDLADPRPLVLTEDKWAGRLGPIDFPTPVSALARVRVPKNFNHRSPHARRDLAVDAAQRPRRERPGRPEGQAPLGGRRRPGARRPAPGAARAPGARAARPRGAGPGGRALAALGPGGRRAAAQDVRAHRLADPAVRRHLRRPGGAGLPRARRSPRWCPPTPRSSARPTTSRWSPTTDGGSRGSGRRPTCWSPSACGPGRGAG